MSARVIFVNRFYWPDEPATSQLLTDLATRLSAQGVPVTVIASRPDSSPATEISSGVEVRRVSSPRFASLGFLGKAAALGYFFLAASMTLVRRVRRGDTLVCLTDPPLLCVPVALLCKMKGARHVHWVQDIYPEVAAAVSGRKLPLALRPLRNWAWRSAALMLTIGSDMAATLTEAGVDPGRIRIVPNWAPAGLSEVSEEEAALQKQAWGLEERFVVMYSGNLGRVHALEPILDLAEALHSDPNISVVLLGGGAQRESLIQAANARGLSNLHFLPHQPRARLSQSLGAGDVHLVTLKQGCAGCVFPSKLYGITAIARPVIYVGPKDAEIAQLIVQEKLGSAFEVNEIQEAVAFIRALASDSSLRGGYQAASRRFSENGGGADAAAQRWLELLRSPALAGAGEAS